MDSLNVQFNAVLGAATEKTFASLRKGLADTAKWLRDVAKAELDMQNAQTAQGIGQVSRAFENLSRTLGGKAVKGAAKDMDQLAKANDLFQSKIKLVQEAWSVFSKDIDKGTMSISEAVKRTSAYDKAMQKLEGDLKAAAVSNRTFADTVSGKQAKLTAVTAAQKALNTQVSLSQIRHLEATGAIKLTANGFQFLNDSAYKLLITNEALIGKVKNLHGVLSEFEKEQRKGAERSKQYQTALKALADSSDGNVEKFKQNVAILKQVEKSLANVSNQTKNVTAEEKKHLLSLDRFSIVAAKANGSIKLVGNSFQILNRDGLKAFGDMSIDTAKKFGILDKSFYTFENKLKTMRATMGLSATAIEKVKNNLIASSKSWTDASAKIDQYVKRAREVGKVGKDVEKLTRDYNALLTSNHRLASDAQKVVNAYKQKRISFEQAKNALKQYSDTMKKEVEQSKRNQATVKRLRVQYESLFTSKTKMAEQANRLIATFKRESGDVSILRTRIANLNKAYIEHIKHTKTLNEGKNKFTFIINELTRSLRTYARYMVASTILRGFTSSINESAAAVIEYDQALHDLVAITNATVEETELLRDTLLETASNTKFAVEEIAYAMKRMGQAGFSTTEIMAGIGNVANLATGTLEDLGSTVDLVASTVKIFNLGMDQTARVADIFANAVNNSRLTMNGLNVALNYIGPIGHQVGLTLEDVTSAMELLADSGMKFSTIGTGLRRILSGLLKPTDKLKQAVAAAGYSLDDINPKIVGFENVIRILPNIIKDASDTFNMFGLRGASVMAALLNRGIDGIQHYKEGLTEVGAASRMAETQMKGLRVQLEMIRVKFQTFFVEMNQKVIPILRVFFEIVKTSLDLLIKFAKSGVGQVSVSLAALTVTILGTYLAFKTFMTMTVGFSGWVLGLESVKKAMVALNITTSTATASMGVQALAAHNLKLLFAALTLSIKSSVAASIAFANTPVGRTLLIITAVLGTVIALWKRYENETKKSLETQAKLRGSFSSLSSQLKVYSKLLDDQELNSKDATERNKELRTSLEAMSKEGGVTGEMAKKLSEELSKVTGSALGTQEVLNNFADDLDNRVSASLQQAAVDAENLYLKSREIKDFFKEFAQGFRDLLLPSKESHEALVRISDSANTLKYIKVPFKAVLQLFGGMKTESEKFLSSVDSMIESYKEMGEEAKDGNKKAERAYRLLGAAAKETVEELLEGKNAVALTEEEILKLAFAHSKAENLSKQHTGALILEMKAYAASAKAAGKQAAQTAAYAESIKGVSEAVRKNVGKMDAYAEEVFKTYIGNVSKLEQEFYKFQLSELERHEAEIKAARANDIENAKQAYNQELLIYNGTLEEKENMRKAHEEHLKRLNQQSKEDELFVLKQKRKVILQQYELAVKDFADHQKVKTEIFQTENEKQLQDLKSKYEQDLVTLDESLEKYKQLQEGFDFKGPDSDFGEDEDAIFLARIERQRQYYTDVSELRKTQFDKEIAHLVLINERQKQFSISTIQDEKKLAEEINKLSKSHVTVQIDALKKRKEEHAKTIEELKNLEKSLTDVIRDAENQKRDLRKSAEEISRQAEYAFLSESQVKYKEDLRLAQETEAAKRELQKGNYQIAFEEAKRLQEIYADSMRNQISNLKTVQSAKKSAAAEEEKIYKELTKLVRSGADYSEIQAKRKELKEIRETLSKAGSEEVSIQRAIKKEKENALEVNKLAEESRERTIETAEEEKKSIQDLIKEHKKGYEDIEAHIETLNDKLKEMTSIYEKEVSSALQTLNEQISDIGNADISNPMRELKKETEDTITIVDKLIRSLQEAARKIAENKKEASSSSSSSSSEGSYRGGGKIPGYGGGDRRNILVEDGEFVLRKEAVKAAGDSFLHDLNNLKLPKFATGGKIELVKNSIVNSETKVYNEEKVKDSHESMTIRFQVGGVEMPLNVVGDKNSIRQQIRMFDIELKKMGLSYG